MIGCLASLVDLVKQKRVKNCGGGSHGFGVIGRKFWYGRPGWVCFF